MRSPWPPRRMVLRFSEFPSPAPKSAGTHVITPAYPANGSFAARNASAVNVTVTSAAAANATSTSIVGAANPQVVRGFAFTATVSLRTANNIITAILKC
jgi:hypothetical protein